MKHNMLVFLFVLAASLVWILATPPSAAQTLVSGDLTGIITDPTGAVIANAKVTIKSLDRGDTQSATSNSTGSYRFSLLTPGKYSVTVSQTGFRTLERSTTVAVGQITSVNLTLQMGQATETIEVSGAAPVIMQCNGPAL